MSFKNFIADVKTDLNIIGSLFVSGGTISAAIKTANIGVTDPAQYVTNVANVVVSNQKSLPQSWVGSNFEKCLIKICTDLESGLIASEIEAIVKAVLPEVASVV